MRGSGDRNRAARTPTAGRLSPAREIGCLSRLASRTFTTRQGWRPRGAFSPQRNRWFADSLLEGTGFELPVRGCDESGFRSFCVALDLCFDHFGAKATGVIIHDRHTRALPGTSSETSPCPSSLFFGEHVLKNVEKRKRIENPRARSRAYLGTNRARVGTNQIISGTNPCLAVEPQ